MIDIYKTYLHLQKLNFKNMSQKLKTDKEKALLAYKNADEKGKQMLKDLYGAENFLTNVKDRVIDYKSACREIGLTPLTLSYFDFLPEWERERAFNRHQVTVGVRALVGDWKPNFTDGTWKYYTYGYENSNGLRLGGSCYRDMCFAGSDLLFPNSDLRDYAQKIFEKQYLTFLF